LKNHFNKKEKQIKIMMVKFKKIKKQKLLLKAKKTLTKRPKKNKKLKE
jgi:hypothetical protein